MIIPHPGNSNRNERTYFYIFLTHKMVKLILHVTKSWNIIHDIQDKFSTEVEDNIKPNVMGRTIILHLFSNREGLPVDTPIHRCTNICISLYVYMLLDQNCLCCILTISHIYIFNRGSNLPVISTAPLTFSLRIQQRNLSPPLTSSF